MVTQAVRGRFAKPLGPKGCIGSNPIPSAIKEGLTPVGFGGINMTRPYNKQCINCGKLLRSDNVSGYCISCIQNKHREERIKLWLETGELQIAPNSRPRYYVRDFIMERQNNKCAICGCDNQWNNQELIFVLDHIDGKSINNHPNNLRLICPNCDSQLPTYKSRNKNSTRTYDREYRKQMSVKVGELA